MSDVSKILVVDDEPGITNLVAAVLAGEGYHVEQANSADEAQQRLSGHRFSLVILDLMMPGAGGWDVYDGMRRGEAHREVPVVILSARIRDVDIKDALHVRKVADYITKPFSVEELVSRVQGILGGRTA